VNCEVECGIERGRAWRGGRAKGKMITRSQEGREAMRACPPRLAALR
jgi:hypothetical protein